MEKVADPIALCRIKENLNRRVMEKARPNGKVVMLTEEMLILIEEEVILIEEEVILILEVDFMVIVLDVAKKGIDPLNVDLLKVGRIIEMM